MKAVIIAAGCGSRLQSRHNGIPKTLLTVGGKRIIDVILDGIAVSGIRDVVVVTGYQADLLEDHIKKNAPSALSVEFTRNPLWELPNGVSVLAAERNVHPDEDFILLMSDHIFETEMLKLVVETPLEPDQGLLALDMKLTDIPDLDDGMKVKYTRPVQKRLEITALDKKFKDYQAIDCGMFKFNYSFFGVLRSSIELGRNSLSDSCNSLAEEKKMIGVDIGQLRWIDLDTPEMFALVDLIDKIIK